MVGALQLTTVGAFGGVASHEGVVGAAHVAARFCDFILRDCHGTPYTLGEAHAPPGLRISGTPTPGRECGPAHLTGLEREPAPIG
jgi:hypothetical protein